MEQTRNPTDADRAEPAQTPLASVRYIVPGPTAGYVVRRRLLARLEDSGPVPLVLVSAPAGAGKTALVADWARQASAAATGWVTFDVGDEQVWPPLLAVLSSLGVDVPARTLSGGRPDHRLLTALAGAVSRLAEPVTVVLDGYEAASAEGAEDLDFLLRHSGHRLRLVVVTRVDPVLPLYRYRLDDSLVELRAADLAFDDDEAADLLAAAGVRLTPGAVHDLNTRIGGWAAGLRFVARTLSERADPERTVADVVAETTDIGEYLLGEVLNAQTPEVRRFLLDTCVPDTLTPGLVEELAGHSAMRVTGQLNGLNTFVEPVPGLVGCFRYHPLFRDLLRAQLSYEAPDQRTELHRRAARWFRREGDLPTAVAHLLAVGDWREAAETVVDAHAVARLLLGLVEDPLVRDLARIPAETPGAAACVVRAAYAVRDGEPDVCTDELSAAGALSEGAGVALCAAVVDAERARLFAAPAEAAEAATRAEHALRHLHQSASPEERALLSALVARCRGVAQFRAGALDDAQHALGTAAGSAETAGDRVLQADCLGRLALVEAVQGRLSEASQHADESLAAADAAGTAQVERPTAALVARAWVAFERYDLRAAHDSTRTALQTRSLPEYPLAAGLVEVVKAGLQRARGHLALARSTLERAVAQTPPEETWLHARLAAELSRGRAPAVSAPSRPRIPRQRVAVDDPETALASAQEHLARHENATVSAVLTPALAQTSSLATRVSGLLVQAAAEAQDGSPGQARTPLEEALRLAAPEGLRRPFHEAPAATRQLLSNGLVPAARTRWLDGAVQQPVEKLTARELEVLGHLDELLTTEEIADVMFVSVNTVRTHVRSILRKLEAPRRNAAVRRARELGLLS